MKNVDHELTVLEKHEVKTDWREKAQWRRDNRRWLRYSGHIALTVMRRLEDLNMSQKELAEMMNCSPQYVSKLLRGSENLTLDTISKLEEALSFDLIGQSLKGYLNDSGVHGPAHEGVNTSDLVDGYKPRKKKGPKGIK